MWRLKLGEGANDPYLFSSNNFVGRQTWDFEVDEGTPEERAEVEEARQNFYVNRFQVQCSSNFFWKFQVFFNDCINHFKYLSILSFKPFFSRVLLS